MADLIIVPIGLLAGVLAGYLGVGGGFVYLPLLFFFLNGRYPAEIAPKICVGTSMGAVVLTGISGTLSHYRQKNVCSSVWWKISIGAVLGSFFGGFIVSMVSGDALRIAIGITLLLSALQMLTQKPPKNECSLENEKAPYWLIPIGIAVGLVAGTVGIGGGILAVPIFSGVLLMKPNRIAGTSSALTIALSASGLIGYFFWGKAVSGAGTVGFVDIKFMLLLGIPAAIGAYFGAGLHKKVPPKIFKYVFAILLIFVALKIVFF